MDTVVFAANSGDQDAFTTLYHEFRSKLRHWTKKYWIPGADRDDVMQHALIGLWEAVRDYDGRVPFLAFAKMCVLREVQAVLRMARRQKHYWHLTALSLDRECPWIDDEDKTVRDVYVDRAAPSVEDIVLDEGLRDDATADELVQWAEEHWGLRFTELERDVLRLRLEGYSYAEIERRIGRGHKSIGNEIQRVRKRVRKALEARKLTFA